MQFFKGMGRFFLNAYLHDEKVRLQNKFDYHDGRLDKLEKDVAVIGAQYTGLSLSFFSHLEALEASINGIRSSQEALNMVSVMQYKHLDDTLIELKAVIRAVGK